MRFHEKLSTGYYIDGKIHRLNTPLEILRFERLSFFDKVLLAKAVLGARRLKDPLVFDDLKERDLGI